MSSRYVGWYHIPPIWIGKPKLDSSDLEFKYSYEFSSNLILKITGDGMFIWDLLNWKYISSCGNDLKNHDATEIERLKQQKITQFFNAYLACLYSGYQNKQGTTPERMNISNDDLIVLSSFKDKPSQIRLQGHTPISLSTHKHVSERMKLKKGEKIDNRFIIRIHEINLDSLNKTSELLEATLKYEKRDLFELLSLINKSSSLVQNNNDNESLLLSWLVIEAMIQEILKEFIEENRIINVKGKDINFITKERKNEILNGSNYPISVTTEILSFVDKIPFQVYQYVTKIRKARNAWVHDLKLVKHTDAMLAISTACHLFRIATNIDFWMPASSSLTSI